MTLFDSLNDIRRRSAEAMLGQTGLNHAGLAEEIRRRFSSEDPNLGGLLQEPILEAALPYLVSQETMDDLSGDLLQPSLVAALDGADPPDRRFLRSQKPFVHQLEAWRLIREQSRANSVLVTSGTGSGKTECFLIPILDDLAEQAASSPHRLEGVQAIMLYPLNALIASQEERLKAWTAPFEGKIRFALYNGLLPDRVKASAHLPRPECVQDRKILRDSPPPILVTNVTMLEYMLLRPQDAPIRGKSRGKLRYVVLDEAHTYVGANAAEIALLLRRVCLAFGVAPADVRFIATSATIGVGPDITEALRHFLSDVSGAPLDRVHVVEGHTRRPELPPMHDGERQDRDAFAHLGGHPKVRPLIESIYAGPTPWSRVAEVARDLGYSASILALGLANAVSETGDRLAPARVHSFHRAAPGLWSCLNSACHLQRPTDWPFGAIHHRAADVCRCGAPIFEVLSCATCGEAYLSVQETNTNRLIRPLTGRLIDDFALDADRDAEEAGDGDTDTETTPLVRGDRKLIGVSDHRGPMRWLWVKEATGQVHDREAPDLKRLSAYDFVEPHYCPACNTQALPGGDLLRSIRFAAPFILGSATPILLEEAARAPNADDPDRWTHQVAPPVSGRQLLSFTDSRQGTARLSAKLQVASERNFVRSFIYHAVQDALAAGADPAAIAKKDQEILALQKSLVPESDADTSQVITNMLAGLCKERQILVNAGLSGIPWKTMVDKLSERPEVRVWIHDVWSKRDPTRFDNTRDLANFLLLREFVRRPPRANAPETMGLARLRFEDIDRVPDAAIPQEWTELGFAPADWRDFLYLLVTFIARGRSAVRVPREVFHWIPPKASPRDLIFRPDRRLAPFEVRWPRYGAGALGRLPIVVTLLEQVSGRSMDDLTYRELFNRLFDAAWNALSPLFAQASSAERRLDLAKAHVAPLVTGYLCPITRRALDIGFRGFTPYGAKARGRRPVVAEPITLPRHPLPFCGAAQDLPPAEAKSTIQTWLDADPTIERMRALGAWTDVGDRIAHFSEYFRSAEHSAQQPPSKLRRYESEFKAGEINVLNCSTTMEMGVDIGSVSHVMMTNLPPSIANYRQRVGRAGRRGQALSLAFTFCRDRPLERDAFRDPIKYLTRGMAAPSVALQSTVVVQRHINAFLFAAFLQEHGANALKMEAGPFFGCLEEIGVGEQTDNSASQFAAWMRDPTTFARFADDLERLTRGSLIEGDGGACEVAALAIEKAREAFAAQWRIVQELAAGRGDDRPAASNLAIQLKRMCGDYLLGVLADRGVLPGHGFPTDVVQFISRQDPPSPDRMEEQSRFNAFPQRSLDMAIREYAPGSEVVLDGLVHRSAGVTLNWRRPADPNGVREVQAIKHRWRCYRCGESGTSQNVDPNSLHCPACHANIAEWFEFLEPAGFAADLREKPHADVDVITFVPPEPTRVSARGAAWLSLFDPTRGRRRADSDGTVFYCNAGPGGLGYGVCLYCGRADDYDPAQPHRPLIGKSAECEGSNKPFARKDGLRLGYEIRTDVFEFQPAGWPERGGALALGIALREALARKLGIDADEMGVAAEARLDAMSGQTMSIFLHDKASGGAGFSVKAYELFADLITEAADILDCKVEGCVRGCPACVMIGDLRDEEVEWLDRLTALALVQERLLVDASPRTEDRVNHNAKFSVDLLDEVRSALEAGGKEAVMYLGGTVDPASLDGWPAAALAKHWASRGRTITLAIEPGVIDQLNGAQRVQLRDQINRWGVALGEGVQRTFPNGARLVAEVRRPVGPALVFASRDPAAWSASAIWGKPDTAPIVRFDAPMAWQGVCVDLDRLREQPGAVLVDLRAEVDGPISSFGDRLAGVIHKMLARLGVTATDDAIDMTYEDRYLKSPATLRLCLDTLSKLKGSAATPVLIRINTFPLEPSARPTHWLDSDWRREDDRLAVARAYAAARGLKLDMHLTHPEHGRRLVLHLKSGLVAEILFDQGFGAWRNDRGVGFDFSKSAADQVKRLAALNCGVRLPPSARTYVVAGLKVAGTAR